MIKLQINYQKYILPRYSIVLLLIFCFLSGASSHLIIYFHQLDSGIRVLQFVDGVVLWFDDCFFNYIFCCHFSVLCQRKIWTTHPHFHLSNLFVHIIYRYKLLFRFWDPPAISYHRVSHTTEILFDQHPGYYWELYFHSCFFDSQHNVCLFDMEFFQKKTKSINN